MKNIKGLILLLFIVFIGSCVYSDTILDRIQEEVVETVKEGKLPVIVFDLDGTLFYTGMRTKKIFLEFAETEGDTVLKKQVETIDARKMKYRVRKSLEDAGISDSLLQKRMIDSWRMKFFDGTYLKYDEPLPGAVEFVNRVYDSGALVVYLTGRDVHRMLQGTVASLEKNGFPIGVQRTELIMKPKRYVRTYTYKKKALRYIKKLGVVIALFENEPANINLLHETFPEAVSVFVETSHKPNAPTVEKEIYHIKTYKLNY